MKGRKRRMSTKSIDDIAVSLSVRDARDVMSILAKHNAGERYSAAAANLLADLAEAMERAAEPEETGALAKKLYREAYIGHVPWEQWLRLARFCLRFARETGGIPTLEACKAVGESLPWQPETLAEALALASQKP